MKYRIYIFSILLIILFVVFQEPELHGQCAMCKANLESNLNEGGSIGKGINKGILYLMAVPYLLFGTIAYFIYKNIKKKAKS